MLGEVTIGPRASVWFNTVVRGDVDTIEIGELSNVQDNSTVHVDEGSPVRIGARVTVGHRAIVHGCVIEDECLIGMGSVLLSGCRIGTGSYIGASSLVLEGMQIPPGSVALGSPARVIGPVGERHREGIRHGSGTYAELAAACLLRGYSRPVGRDGEILRELPDMTRWEWNARLDSLHELPKRISRLVDRALSDDPGGLDRTKLRELLDALGRRDSDRLACVEQLRRGQPFVWGERAWAETVSEAVGGEAWMMPEPPDDLRYLLLTWRRMRAFVTGALEKMGPPEWRLASGHAIRGPLMMADLVREWVEFDLEALDGVRTKRGGRA